jgi:hypothetical protein
MKHHLECDMTAKQECTYPVVSKSAKWLNHQLFRHSVTTCHVGHCASVDADYNWFSSPTCHHLKCVNGSWLAERPLVNISPAFIIIYQFLTTKFTANFYKTIINWKESVAYGLSVCDAMWIMYLSTDIFEHQLYAIALQSMLNPPHTTFTFSLIASNYANPIM